MSESSGPATSCQLLLPPNAWPSRCAAPYIQSAIAPDALFWPGRPNMNNLVTSEVFSGSKGSVPGAKWRKTYSFSVPSVWRTLTVINRSVVLGLMTFKVSFASPIFISACRFASGTFDASSATGVVEESDVCCGAASSGGVTEASLVSLAAWAGWVFSTELATCWAAELWPEELPEAPMESPPSQEPSPSLLSAGCWLGLVGSWTVRLLPPMP